MAPRWEHHALLHLHALQSSDDRQRIADDLWNTTFACRLHPLSTADELLTLFHDLSIATLTAAGATWSHGPRTRGTLPVLVASPVTKKASREAARDAMWAKLLRLVRELYRRLPRFATASAGDAAATRSVLAKARRLARELRLRVGQWLAAPELLIRTIGLCTLLPEPSPLRRISGIRSACCLRPVPFPAMSLTSLRSTCRRA